MKKSYYSTLGYRQMPKTSFASLVNRGVTNVNGLASTAWKDDESFMALWNDMLEHLSIYEAPIVQVLASVETTVLEEAKRTRYWAYLALRRAVSVHAVSELEAERIGSKMLNDLFKVNKLKNQNNKENQTTIYKLLTNKLLTPEYLPTVTLLNVKGNVDRLVASNAVFVAQESGTSMSKKQSKELNPVEVRKILTDNYEMVLNYVQGMEAIGKVPFSELFTALDEARSYFARDIQYRKTLLATKKALMESKKTETPPTKAA